VFTVIIGIIHFILVVYGIVSVLTSGLETSKKALWILLIILLPIIGLIL
jgi:hypothetical protein